MHWVFTLASPSRNSRKEYDKNILYRKIYFSSHIFKLSRNLFFLFRNFNVLKVLRFPLREINVFLDNLKELSIPLRESHLHLADILPPHLINSFPKIQFFLISSLTPADFPCFRSVFNKKSRVTSMMFLREKWAEGKNRTKCDVSRRFLLRLISYLQVTVA